ncbi:hypothetical protein ARMSODRAFT_979921 [Armillaria solidipes]|uniref:Uncharacterized protein n=1 Tax=Armillaria solidipes TaxID=1076256 RepID=A0A2H3BBW6_9AGAR|nr:hypothetical protein ARMSODRAFT_979921 [Armillaria solidipes]
MARHQWALCREATGSNEASRRRDTTLLVNVRQVKKIDNCCGDGYCDDIVSLFIAGKRLAVFDDEKMVPADSQRRNDISVSFMKVVIVHLHAKMEMAPQLRGNFTKQAEEFYLRGNAEITGTMGEEIQDLAYVKIVSPRQRLEGRGDVGDVHEPVDVCYEKWEFSFWLGSLYLGGLVQLEGDFGKTSETRRGTLGNTKSPSRDDSVPATPHRKQQNSKKLLAEIDQLTLLICLRQNAARKVRFPVLLIPSPSSTMQPVDEAFSPKLLVRPKRISFEGQDLLVMAFSRNEL